MLTLTNTYIIIDKEYLNMHTAQVSAYMTYLTYTDRQSAERQAMYLISDNTVRIPIGYLEYLDIDLNASDVVDMRTKLVPGLLEPYATNPDIIKSILPGITLRDDQVLTVMLALLKKSGMFQLATGAGKTEIICAIIKYWHTKLNYYPNIIILEPTVKLVGQTIARLGKYGIEASEYKSDRVIDGIKVTHPASIYNDLEKNPEILSGLNCIICDEGHHLSAVTWRTILANAKNLEVRLVFSASLVAQEKVNFTSLLELDFDEHLIIGVAGKLLVNFPPAFYITKGVLATPVAFRIFNPADEELLGKKSRYAYKFNGVDYASIKRNRLGSLARAKQCAYALTPFVSSGRKILVLAETKEFAFTILNELWQIGYGPISRTVFGGNEYYKQNEAGTVVKEANDPVEMLTAGEINIVIATSVMYEGADISTLDVVVLYSVGVEQRVFIQGIGRVLRKGKTGKYAYIMDFTDHECDILSRHSEARREMLKTIIGIEEKYIFDSIQTQEILPQYLLLEKAEDAHGD